MNAYGRYVIVVFTLLISIHYIVSFTHVPYRRATSLSTIVSKLQSPRPVAEVALPAVDEHRKTVTAPDRRANATFVILARNSDLNGAVRSVRRIEERFNSRYRYPYVFLNEEPFSEDFKKRVSILTSAKIEFGLIPRDHWFQPDWIDEERATKSRDEMVAKGVIYAGSVSYRNMCRFNSGFFFRHPLMQKYRWYWRIEPEVDFHCDINYDPFRYMESNNKTYGFTITMFEFQATVETLWGHVVDFAKSHPQYIAKDNSLRFLSSDNGQSYNLCHFWSNFEIADLDFWRGEAYTKFFEYLDSKGGFYYERWGDAPVHSIAAGLFASQDQIHFFHDIGYEHNPFTHCPKDEQTWKAGRCSCNPDDSFDYAGYSCLRNWDRLKG